jgi:epoxyqueuosine reductase
MTPAERTRWIDERARATGFDLCGVAPVGAGDLAREKTEGGGHVQAFDELSRLPEWLARGYAGEMGYLHDPRRSDPRLVLEGAQSLVVVALNYNAPPRVNERGSADTESPRGWISRYAWGDDYHDVIQAKLKALIAEMHAKFPEPFEARAYTDTGPIIERVAAKYAGLGWLAKNTCLINSKLGSWIFLGVIVTTLALEPSLAPGSLPPADLCGKCTRCLDACPTQSFPEPYVLDARRCISYLTIELRGGIPEKFREQMGGAVIGCDICQDVCPWNRKAPVTALAAFQPREVVPVPRLRGQTRNSGTADNDARGVSNSELRVSLFAPELEWLAALSQQEFSAVFRRSAVKRARWRGFVRNASIALGNSSVGRNSTAFGRVVQLLERLARSDDLIISDHARWALARLTGSPAPVPAPGFELANSRDETG